MKECNEKKKQKFVSPESLSKTEFRGNPGPVLTIISGISGSFICGYLLFIAYVMLGGEYKLYSDCFLDLKWHIAYTFLLGLTLGIFISSGVRKSKYTNKKCILFLTILSILLAYLFFNFAVYIKYDFQYGSRNILDFPRYVSGYATYSPLRFKFTYGIDYSGMHAKMHKYTEPLRTFVYIITLGKIDREYLPAFINMQIWLYQFLISFLCAWKLIKFICPWLSESELSGKDKRSWFSFLMKKPEKNDRPEKKMHIETSKEENIGVSDTGDKWKEDVTEIINQKE